MTKRRGEKIKCESARLFILEAYFQIRHSSGSVGRGTMATPKPTTCKEAIKKFETAKGVKAAEEVKVRDRPVLSGLPRFETRPLT